MKALILGDGAMAKVHREAYEALGVEIVENDPDIVSICTPDFMHGQQVIDSLNAGCHVMCEKPLCTKIEEFDQIHALSGESKICVNYPLRGHSAFSAFPRNPLRFSMKYHYGRRHKLEAGWRSHKDYSEIMGGMIHLIDFACFKTGLRLKVQHVARESEHIVRAYVKTERGGTGKFTSDFAAYDDHYHKIDWHDENGHVRVVNRWKTDKQREIKNFVNALQVGSWSNDGYFHPTRIALEIDRASHQVR